MKKFKNNYPWAITIFFCLSYTLSISLKDYSFTRLLVYITPAISLIIGIAFFSTRKNNNNIIIRFFVFQASVIYIVMFTLSSFSNQLNGFEYIRDPLIILGSILTFLFYFEITSSMVVFIFSTNVLILLIAAIQSKGIGSFNILQSTGILESSAAYPLAAMCLYFFIGKRWAYLATCIVVLVIASKRSAMLATCCGIAFYAITSHLSIFAKKVNILAAYSACIFGAAVALNFGKLVEAFIHYADIGLSANHFSMGRYLFHEKLSSYVENRGYMPDIFGSGAGTADNIIQKYFIFESNPHNDWLKVYVDYGWVGICLYISIINKIFGSSKEGVSFIVFTSILMITENTMIYYFHLFTVYFCFLHIEQNKKKLQRKNKLLKAEHPQKPRPLS